MMTDIGFSKVEYRIAPKKRIVKKKIYTSLWFVGSRGGKDITAINQLNKHFYPWW